MNLLRSLQHPFLGGYELAAVYLCISLLLLAGGAGRFSLDHLLGTAVMRTKD